LSAIGPQLGCCSAIPVITALVTSGTPLSHFHSRLGLDGVESSRQVDDKRNKKQNRKATMKKQYSSMVSWRAMYLLAGFMALGHAANAQEGTGITIKDAADSVISGVPAPHVMMVLHGQDIGSSLLRACDTNQDGAASTAEVDGALLNWFQHADTDSNGSLSETELATALKSLFPTPQPPPGVPPPPEEMALHNPFAKKLMITVDANKDGWMTFQEALTLVTQNFAKWDANSNGSLDASELAAAFAELMPTPALRPSIETGQGAIFTQTFPYAL
jgi:Ca2+-binding EF-hand superfamily protein